MKTQNILKGIRLMTFVIAGIFISFNLSAGEPQMKDGKSNECCDAAIEVQNENSIGLNEWMLKDENFVVTEDLHKKVNLEQVDNEIPLQLEDWMMSSEFFMIEEEREFGKIDIWMLDDANFQVAAEEDLDEIEDWMVNPDFWKI